MGLFGWAPMSSCSGQVNVGKANEMTFLCVARECGSITGFGPKVPVEKREAEEHFHRKWSHWEQFEAESEDSGG